MPLTFDSSIDHFLLYTVKGKYSDSTRGLGRSTVIGLLIFKDHFHYALPRSDMSGLIVAFVLAQ